MIFVAATKRLRRKDQLKWDLRSSRMLRSIKKSKDFLTLEDGTDRCPESLVRNNHLWLHNIAEQCTSHLLQGRSLKSHDLLCSQLDLWAFHNDITWLFTVKLKTLTWNSWYVSFHVFEEMHFRTLFISDIALHHHVHCPTFQNPHLWGSMVHFWIHIQDHKRTVFRNLHKLPAPTERTEQHRITHCTVPQRWKGLIHSMNNNPWNHCQTFQHMQHSCNTRVRY
jgi:hypothetical protein